MWWMESPHDMDKGLDHPAIIISPFLRIAEFWSISDT